MKTDLAVVRSTLAPSVPALRVTAALAQASDDTLTPHPDIGPPSAYRASVQAEAEALLRVLAPFCQPVPQQ